MIHAPDTIRMAIGIRTAHTFTIKQLFEKLCQKTCDGTCNHLAPYIDMFRLTRTCLEVGGLPRCSNMPGNFAVEHAKELYGLTQADMIGLKKFKAVEGDYGKYWNYIKVHKLPNPNISSPNYPWYYDGHDVIERAASLGKKGKRTGFVWPFKFDPSSKYTAVFAPWLNEKEADADFGVFCHLCQETETAKIALYGSPRGSRYNLYYTSRAEHPNPRVITFCTDDGLAEHMRRAHCQKQPSLQELEEIYGPRTYAITP